MLRRRPPQNQPSRRGAALVEFSIFAPLFLMLVLGSIEIGNALRVSNLMAAAVREGGRLATMDWQGAVSDGDTINDKVMQDIRNFLIASGLPGDAITLTISGDGDSAGQAFDLSDPDNSLKLFRIEAVIPYDEVSTWPANFMGGQQIRSSLTFRAGRISRVQ